MFKGLFGKRGTAPAEPYPAGAYRRHRPEDIGRFTELAVEAFPEMASRIRCFGADWLGRQFATDSARIEGGEPLVLLLEPGTGEALEIPVTLGEFHDSELVEQAEAAIAVSFYQRWLASGGAAPAYDQCVGYRTPLYLGGADDLSNLEITDFDVYWTISAQLLAKVRAAV